MPKIKRIDVNKQLIALALLVVLLTVTFGYCARTGEPGMLSENIKSIKDVKNLFPKTPQEIEQDTAKYIQEAKGAIDAIIAIPKEKRTFANTAKALDDLESRSNASIKASFFYMVKYLYPQQEMRDAAQQAVQRIEDFFIDNVSNNKKLYEAFKAYAQGNALKEDLNAEQRYFIEETMKGFKRAGLDLPDEQLEKVKKLKKKLTELALKFDRNIAQDASTIEVTRDELAGLPDDFIDALKKTDNGKHILGVDYPTYFRVMEYSTIEPTRKRLYEVFSNRAYPANEQLLKDIVALRDELAKLLGYESFAALNIDDQMVKNAENAEAFLQDLRAKAEKKDNQELDKLIKELPESVELTSDGKIKGWDHALLKTRYKQKHFNIDEQKIAEYFPMEHTIEQLLDIYRQFLGVDFKEVPISGLWHEDVKAVKVYNKDRSQLYGYLFLDLHPRPNKFSHAANAGIVPAIKLPDGSRLPAVSVVMANFTKPTKDKPSLLLRNEVRTFFHEFGHALHALLGATELGSFAGTSVKTDFVEMPSQMLEEWLWDKEILKKVSKHYQTSEPLSDEVIDNIIALKRYDSGGFVTRQVMLSQYALDMFKPGADKDPYTILHTLLSKALPRMYYGPEYRFFANFGHLTGYGAKYYGYLWSKVFALDLFDTIKKTGLLNPEIGKRYVTEIIGKGGSVDPNQLLKNFLGREPRKDAFIRDLGLEA